MQALGTSSYVLMWTLVYAGAIALSLLVVGGAVSLSTRFSGDSFKSAFTRFSYALIPLAVGIHTAFNMPRFFGVGGLNRAAHNLLAIFGYSFEGPFMVLDNTITSALMVALVVAGLIGSSFA